MPPPVSLLLVDSFVVGYEAIVSAAKGDVAVVVFDSMADTYESLLTKISEKGLTTVEYVGLVQHGSAMRHEYHILKSVAPALLSDATNPELPSWGSIVDFFKALKLAYSVSVIDLISCDLYSRPEWVEVINKLEALTDVKLRASSDATGNLANGGNWVMESDNVNIEGLYFTEAIKGFKRLLFSGASIGGGKSTLEMVTSTNKTTTRMVSQTNPANNFIKLNTPETMTLIVGQNPSIQFPNIIGAASSGETYAIKNDGSIIRYNNGTLTTINGIYTAIASNGWASAAITSGGNVFAWGSSSHGGSNVPHGLSHVVAICATDSAFAALTGNGNVVAWGNRWYGGETPYNLTNIKSLASTGSAFAALTYENTVVVWGDSSAGGSGVPSGLNNVAVATIASNGYQFAALTNDGKVFTWGSVWGVPLTTTPAALSNAITVAIASTNQAFAALTSDGKVVTWGLGGASGSGGDTSAVVSQQLDNAVVVALASTDNAFAALTSTGNVITWGRNWYGWTYGSDSSAVQIKLMDVIVVSIASNQYGFAALTSDGKVVSWGNGINSSDTDDLRDVIEIYGYEGSFLARRANGSVFIWGGISQTETISNLLHVSKVIPSGGGFALFIPSQYTDSVPDAPTALSAVASNQQATLSWTAPVKTGGPAISKYTVYNSLHAVVADNVLGTTTTTTIPNLTNGSLYTYYVKATNSVGEGPASSSVTVMPLNTSASTVNTSALVVSDAAQAAQIISAVSSAPAALYQQVASAVVAKLAVSSSVADVIAAGKAIADTTTNATLKSSYMSAAGSAAVSSTASTASSVAGKMDEYSQRMTTVLTETKNNTTLGDNLKDIVGGAAAAVLNTVGEAPSLTIPALLIAANNVAKSETESGTTKTAVKIGTVVSVEQKASGSSIAVPSTEVSDLVASIRNQDTTFAAVAANGLNILVANKDTRDVMLPTDGSVWYVPMTPGLEYTFKNILGPETARFVYNAATGTLTKGTQTFNVGDQFTLNGWVYPNYAIGSVGGANAYPAPTPIEVNLNVEVNAQGEIKILSETAPVVDNVVVASTTLPVNCLYKEAGVDSKGLIEFWEPEEVDDIVCQLAQSPDFGASGYQETAQRLVRGLQAVLCGSLDATEAVPFKASNYSANDRVMTGFGRLALMAYAHYLLGHVQATAAITNDKEFIKAMLSLKSETVDVTTILPSNYLHTDILQDYVQGAAPYSTIATTSDANLAARLVNEIITKNPSTSLVSNGSSGSLASIVKQVLGQDANRAVNADNSKYGPERHGLLKFFAGDVIFVTITLDTPVVAVNNGQKVLDDTIKGRYTHNNKNKYTLKITLA